MRMRMLSVGWIAMMATAGVPVGDAQASAAREGTVASPARTIEWSASRATPDVGATPHGAVVAQSQITAGPLQGPLAAREADRPGARCPVPVRRVVHHRRMARRAPPPVVVVTALPLVPFVPAYAYPPPVMFRPVVPVYAFRPFYRPRFYRPYFYRPHFYRGFY